MKKTARSARPGGLRYIVAHGAKKDWSRVFSTSPYRVASSTLDQFRQRKQSVFSSESRVVSRTVFNWILILLLLLRKSINASSLNDEYPHIEQLLRDNHRPAKPIRFRVSRRAVRALWHTICCRLSWHPLEKSGEGNSGAV